MSKNLTIGIVIILVLVGVWYFYSMKSSGGNMSTEMPSSSTNSASASGTPDQNSAKNAVTIQNMAFSPASLTVKVGDQVTWTNQDSVGHSATADDSSFDTGILGQGESKIITFSKAGTYAYHCSVHPSMKATITVQ